MVDSKENYKFGVGVRGLNGIFLLRLDIYLSLLTSLSQWNAIFQYTT